MRISSSVLKIILGNIFIYLWSTFPVTASVVTQKIRYIQPSASEVYLVWGLNNWMLPEQTYQPSETTVKKNLAYTRLKKDESGFYTELKIPEGTKVDFVFWISLNKDGFPTDIWDDNRSPSGKDYHLVATGKPYLVNSKVKMKSNMVKVPPFFLYNSLKLALILSLILLIIKPSNSSFRARLISFLLAFMLVRLFIRADLTGVIWNSGNIGTSFGTLFLRSGQDQWINIFVFLLILPLILLEEKIRYKYLWKSIAIGFSSILLLYECLNIKINEILGRPLNYQWLYYADMLKSKDSLDAVSHTLDIDFIFNLGGLLISLFILSKVVQRPVDKLLGVTKKKWVVGGICLISLFPIFLRKDAKPENPVLAMVRTLPMFEKNAGLFNFPLQKNQEFIKEENSLKSFGDKRFQNVVLIVLESTFCNYLDVYGGGYSVTPHLQELSRNAYIFRNFYAHAPATNKSMVCMQSSCYPWLSYGSITEEKPNIQLKTLSQVLLQKSYSTAFFNGGDLDFQGARNFLKNHGFQTIRDFRDYKGAKIFETNNKEWKNLDGSSDQDMLESAGKWIEENKGRPFFLTAWTYQTHYPYFTRGKEEQLSSNPDFNRYLNALKEIDAGIGELYNKLKSFEILDKTLIVIVGDHGEAFGQHQQLTHANHIYEENLKVPFMIINPNLSYKEFKNQGGLVDLAPTLANLLNISPDPSWQGISLISGKSHAPYFFAPWSEYLFGMRDGNMKVVFNAESNEFEMYDLEKDPLENNNLASEMPEKQRYYKIRLAAWAQYQDGFMKKLFSKK